jgi:hypothetical protein
MPTESIQPKHEKPLCCMRDDAASRPIYTATEGKRCASEAIGFFEQKLKAGTHRNRMCETHRKAAVDAMKFDAKTWVKT